jgi:hypothetical protein
MNTKLWEEILKFSFDHPNESYGFSIRLALKNNWTIYFTQKAILEYKKFMFLAATNNEMVSPSEIVDIVWHQHLIFTKSYSDLCSLLSKRIEHIPSTHNISEVEKFKKAKERTKELYEIAFGVQPLEFWDYENELDTLNLSNSKFRVARLKKIFPRFFVLVCILIYFMIYPILIKIDNPDFLTYYVLFFALVILSLELFARINFKSIFDKIKSNLILSNLSPFELVFLKESKLEAVIHGAVNNLIKNGKIEISANNRLNLIDKKFTDNDYENCIIIIMSGFESMPYVHLCQLLIKKPVFEQLQNATDRIKERIINSKEFMFVVIVTMITLGGALSVGVCRIFAGISRGKPVTFLVIVVVILVLFSVSYLDRVLKLLFGNIIPLKIKEEKKSEGFESNWEWNYFVYGNVLLTSAFGPLVNNINDASLSRDLSKVNSGGSACGSSCGSSCGGCGGCGGD